MAYKRDEVAQQMRAIIVSGEWGVGDSIGDMFALAHRFEVSVGTIRHAEDILVREGLLSEIRPGIPTRVIAVPATENPNTTVITRLRAMQQEIDALVNELEGAQ